MVCNLKSIDKIYVWGKYEKQSELGFLPIVTVDRKIKLHLAWEMKIYAVHPEKKDVNYCLEHLEKARQ